MQAFAEAAWAEHVVSLRKDHFMGSQLRGETSGLYEASTLWEVITVLELCGITAQEGLLHSLQWEVGRPEACGVA